MNAAEAKKRATMRAKMDERRRVKKEQDEIMKIIEEFVDNGCFSCTINGLFYDDTVKYLRDLGYKVTKGIGCTKIKWE